MPHKQQVVGSLWDVAGDESREAAPRFRAACALATYDGENERRWQGVLPFVSKQLVLTLNRYPRDTVPVLEALEPVRKTLAKPVSDILRDESRGESERNTALSIFLEYAFDDSDLLSDVLADVDHHQFVTVFPHVEKLKPDVVRPPCCSWAKRTKPGRC